jgi:hypothetical protein
MEWNKWMDGWMDGWMDEKDTQNNSLISIICVDKGMRKSKIKLN